MKTKLTFLFLIFVAAFVAGCGSTSAVKNQYALAALQVAKQQTQPLPITIEVSPFTIDPKFSTKKLVYRLSQYRYVPDHYEEYFVPPSVMITETTRNWLTDSGLFATVLDPGSVMTPSYLLEGNIAECYADIRDKTKPSAVLKLRLFLVKRDRIDSIVWNKTYDAAKPMKSIGGESFIEALNECLQNVLLNLNSDLSALQFK